VVEDAIARPRMDLPKSELACRIYPQFMLDLQQAPPHPTHVAGHVDTYACCLAFSNPRI